MGILDSIMGALGIPTNTDIERRVNEAYEAGFYDGNDDPATSDLQKGGYGYKRHMSDQYVRDGKIDFSRALETAWALWQKSPIAKRVLTMKRDHIIGHNSNPATDDDDLLEIFDGFWKANRLDKRASEFVLQLFGFGEQCYPAFVREADGRVLLGYIDPASISRIIKHPENTLEDWMVVINEFTDDVRAYRIIRVDENYVDETMAKDSEYAGKLVTWEQATLEPWEQGKLADLGLSEYTGSCFYFKVNAVSNQSRGMSDLLQVGDWIDQADDVLFGLADREQFAGYFSFDVTLQSADAALVKQRSKEIRSNPPGKGSVNVHNDAESWEMFAPDLHSVTTIETFRAILGLVLGGLGFPVHWFGYGDDANKATAAVQADPTTKTLEHDQGIVQDMFLTIMQFVADQAEILGRWSPGAEYEMDFDLPEVSVKDISRISASASQLVMALLTAVGEGWLSKETAAKAFARVLSELDIQIDVVQEMEQALKDKDEDALDVVASQNGQLNRQLQQVSIDPEEIEAN